jgi:hypothetical protein
VPENLERLPAPRQNFTDGASELRKSAEGSVTRSTATSLGKRASQIASGAGWTTSFISAARMASPQVTIEAASSNLGSYSASAASSASDLLADVQMSDSASRSNSISDMEDVVPTSDAATNTELSSLSLRAMPPPSTSIWSKRKPLSPREVILRALAVTDLPEPKKDEALFLPNNADRLWYLGFIRPWKRFNAEAMEFWNSSKCRATFQELKPYSISPSDTERDITAESHGSEILFSRFRSEVMDTIQNVYNKLTGFPRFKYDNVPNEVLLGDFEDEDLGNAEAVWEPNYIVKTSRDGGDEETRILGQVEYLGGRRGALTWAIKECAKNSWGSLRCVLGKLFCFSWLINNITEMYSVLQAR